ncbi:MAG: DUF4230 domain-containing protein [Cyanobacteria bacterium]|nr:DUF4230 domain-containing protein [Cyanobacteria bacterium CG_2015-16_32_12]NCO78809.1 DUF4230 domain-containing protein [Cyanobacteria bacterium CG_2015-22_32_23]NCQ04650.1 DUF4230 domain-containing protein [Cyanobacteria bacterium CG_2015-09_32_10]NCS85902.1 DUF4230 domain-containing protein [Cyanobacteria bacterium CG_2015-02_32_10]
MNIYKSFIFHSHILKNTALITSGSFILIILFGVLGMGKITNNFIESITHIFDHEITPPQINNPHFIVKQIQAVSELTTTKFVMDAIVPTSSSRKLGNWVIGETSLLYVARGEVKAGLDLSKITTDNIQVNEDTLKITLPAPKILDEKIDVNQSQVYDYNRGFLNLGPDIAPQLQEQAQRQTLVKIKETACAQQILNQANEKAVILVTQLMQTAGYQNVEVITTPSHQCL